MAIDGADEARRCVLIAVLIGCAVLAAVAGTMWAAWTVPVTAGDAGVLALLLALEIGYVEALRLGSPRTGRPARGNRASVTVFAGALLLTPVAAAVLPLLVQLYERRLGPPPRDALPARDAQPADGRLAVYGVAATVLASLAATP